MMASKENAVAVVDPHQLASVIRSSSSRLDKVKPPSELIVIYRSSSNRSSSASSTITGVDCRQPQFPRIQRSAHPGRRQCLLLQTGQTETPARQGTSIERPGENAQSLIPRRRQIWLYAIYKYYIPMPLDGRVDAI